ncbi:putative nuclease HARBI1 [Palaemon carinicauda]|uniref:putative nuclease HARBI1 n=1 Tax=Palaemon carinicauda TaxID=392227 RepID=UPI0035B59B84
MEKALISVLLEEFMDDSLEVDNFILQTTSKASLANLSVLACFDDGSRSAESIPAEYDEYDDIPSPEPPRRKRRRGRGRGRGRGASVGRKRGRGRGRGRSFDPVPLEVLAECVIPHYSDIDFRIQFGMSRVTFEELCTQIAPALAYRTITAEKKVLLTVWILRSRESYGAVSERFDVSKGFLHGICSSVCSALAAIQKEFIKMPEPQEFEKIADGFYQRCQFPGVVGAIGCTHIPIREPSKNTEWFINKEGSFSIQLQAVCDDQLKFLHVHTGCPGLLNNAQVFFDSPLFSQLEDNYLPSGKHLLGDCSYPLKLYLLVPFAETAEMTKEQKKFNENLAYTRSEVDLAMKLLKQKFKRLKFLDIKQVDDMSKVIKAACVLYNFILCKETIEDDVNEIELVEEQDEFEVDLAPEPYPVDSETDEDAHAKRLAIVNSPLCLQD